MVDYQEVCSYSRAIGLLEVNPIPVESYLILRYEMDSSIFRCVGHLFEWRMYSKIASKERK